MFQKNQQNDTFKKKVKSNQKNKIKKNDIKDLIYEANKYEI